jgi:hypothetical protein
MIEKYSEILEQNIFIDHEAGKIKTADGLTYNRKELKLLKDCSPPMKRGLHKIKLFFDGEICPNDTKRLLIR